MEPEKAEVVVMEVPHHYNFLRKSIYSANMYALSGTFNREVGGQIPNSYLMSLLPIENMPRRSALDVKELRNKIADYFVNEGVVSW